MKSHIQILHLDDDPNDAKIIQSALQAGGVLCATTCVQSRDDFVAALENGGFDVILSDAALPSFDGMAALRVVRSRWPAIPLIFVSGTPGEERAVDLLKSGATDYVLKERLDRLAPAVRQALKEVERRKRAEKSLAESELRHRSLFESMLEGFAYCRMLYADGQPQDYIYLEVNRAFENLTGIANPVGRKSSEVVPGHREVDPELLERFGRVSMTGQPERFEFYSTRYTKWFSISASCPKKEHFISVFDDITERKQGEKRRQMLAQEIIAVREEERKQLSSVLHHDVGSLAVGISACFDSLESKLHSGNSGEALEELRRTRRLFDNSIASLKGMAIEIRPPELDVLGLGAALRQHFSRITESTGIEICFTNADTSCRVPENVATILFRVVQEALTNAIKHGRATQLDVRILSSPAEISLTIVDNGTGFDPSETLTEGPPHLGLRVMLEMATAVGGTFMIDSARDQGTTLLLRVPIKPAGAKAPRTRAYEATRAKRRKARRAVHRPPP